MLRNRFRSVLALGITAGILLLSYDALRKSAETCNMEAEEHLKRMPAMETEENLKWMPESMEEPTESSDEIFGDLHSNGIMRGASPEMLNFRDQLFAPILEKFKKMARKDYAGLGKSRFRSGDIPKAYVYILDRILKSRWLEAHIEDITEGVCPLPCKITTDTKEIPSSDAVMIHVRSMKDRETVENELGPRDPSQPWVMFEVEHHLKANNVFHLVYKTLDGFFNRTLHHRRDSDILIPHGFIVRRGPDAAFLPPTWRRPPKMHRSNTTRRIVAAFISNCDDNNNRKNYIKSLQKYIKVDVYGNCGTLNCGSSRIPENFYRSDSDPCMKLCSEKYLFFLAFENARCTDYVTEKLYNLIYYPLVPVVLGAANYSELMPPHSVINAGDYTPKDLAEKLKYLAANPQEYEKYFEWRHYFQPSTVGGARVFCDLCFRLYDPKFYEYNVYEDFFDWYVTKANCNRSGTVFNYYGKQYEWMKNVS